MAYDEDLADRIRIALQEVDDVTEMRMFGGLAFLLRRHLAVAAGGHGGLMVRVDPEQAESLLEHDGAAPMEMRGREMRGWLRVEPRAFEDDGDLQRWVDVGVSYAASLPPK